MNIENEKRSVHAAGARRTRACFTWRRIPVPTCDRRTIAGGNDVLRIIVIGKCRDRRLAALADDYVARIRPLAPVEVVELKDADPRREAADMVRRLGARDPARPVIALDEHGEDLASTDLARLLGAHGSLAFLVGGADGLGDEARARADRTVRLSSLTLTHEMARVLLLEQVYRGLTILRGLPYHRA